MGVIKGDTRSLDPGSHCEALGLGFRAQGGSICEGM